MDTGKANRVTGYELRPAVRLFAEAMEKILRENDHKSGWGFRDCSNHYLLCRLIGEVGELFSKSSRATDYYVDTKELVDVANFAMMLWNRAEGTLKYR